jgi:omega-6 fatty acid desaturase (delta-12 desaturase)
MTAATSRRPNGSATASACRSSPPDTSSSTSTPPASAKLRVGRWPSLVAPYRVPDTARSLVQLATTVAAFIVAWATAYLLIDVSIVLTLLVDLLLGGVIVRLFIIQHDCGHDSFFRTAAANRLTGTLTSVLLLTPFGPWRTAHAIHHATTGHLDKRGTGDVVTWTVDEYREASPLRRLGYRLVRHPLTILIAGPFAVFAVSHRLPGAFPNGTTAEVRRSVHLTTLANVALLGAIFWVFGWKGLLLVHVPAGFVACASGIFLFYVQHQFPEPYWASGETWDHRSACVDGCSHLRLPRLLAWFSGDIGVHHLHHFAPRIPNYRLRACLASAPEALAASTTMTLRDAVAALKLNLVDVEQGKMVSFADVELPTRA